MNWLPHFFHVKCILVWLYIFKVFVSCLSFVIYMYIYIKDELLKNLDLFDKVVYYLNLYLYVYTITTCNTPVCIMNAFLVFSGIKSEHAVGILSFSFYNIGKWIVLVPISCPYPFADRPVFRIYDVLSTEPASSLFTYHYLW